MKVYLLYAAYDEHYTGIYASFDAAHAAGEVMFGKTARTKVVDPTFWVTFEDSDVIYVYSIREVEVHS